jgi:hypothetical protein
MPIARASLAGLAVLKKCGDIAVSVHYGNNLNWPSFRAIDDEVVADRPEAHGQRSKISVLVTHARKLCRLQKRPKEHPDKPIRCRRTIAADVVPKLFQILVGIPAKDIAAHPLGLRRF